MPLSKQQLKNDIQDSLEKAKKAYDNGDEDALNPSVIADNIVDQAHDQLELKIDKLAKAQIQIIQAVISGLAAITPPGQGTVGATLVQNQTTQIITELNKIQADIEKYQG